MVAPIANDEQTLRTPLFDADDTFDIGSDDEIEEGSSQSNKTLPKHQKGSASGRSHRD